MAKFNRSSFMRERHQSAREQRQYYSSLTGKKQPYSSFMKSETPLYDEIEVYEVSYQVSYTSAKNGLSLKSANTFEVYAVKGANVEDDIYNRTVEAVYNMKSKDSKEKLNTGAMSMIETQLKAKGSKNKVEINKKSFPRGMEKSKVENIDSQIISKLKTGDGFYTKTKDQNITVGNKTGGKYSFKADIDKYVN